MIIDFASGAISQQPTALSMGVWNWSIVEGEGPVAVAGPYQVVQGEVYNSGPDAGSVYSIGPARGELYVSGPAAGEVG